MASVRDAEAILRALGLPSAQQNEISCLVLLALCGLGKRDSWQRATRSSLTVTKGIMDFIAMKFHKQYAPNTRETVRRQVLHQFVQAQIAEYNPDNPDLPTNSPRAHYALSEAALKAIRAYRTKKWPASVKRFVKQKGSLLEIYEKRKKRHLVPARLPDGTVLSLSPGKHNIVQAAVIQEFVPRFAPGATVLYVGDTRSKQLHVETERLATLGFPITRHDKLPDVVLHLQDRDWLILVEAVTSHGPMSPKRVAELSTILASCPSKKVYVTAFPDFKEFRRHIDDIAWETEVWISEIPDHMIHYNGERFLGPP